MFHVALFRAFLSSAIQLHALLTPRLLPVLRPGRFAEVRPRLVTVAFAAVLDVGDVHVCHFRNELTNRPASTTSNVSSVLRYHHEAFQSQRQRGLSLMLICLLRQILRRPLIELIYLELPNISIEPAVDVAVI